MNTYLMSLYIYFDRPEQRHSAPLTFCMSRRSRLPPRHSGRMITPRVVPRALARASPRWPRRSPYPIDKNNYRLYSGCPPSSRSSPRCFHVLFFLPWVSALPLGRLPPHGWLHLRLQPSPSARPCRCLGKRSPLCRGAVAENGYRWCPRIVRLLRVRHRHLWAPEAGRKVHPVPVCVRVEPVTGG